MKLADYEAQIITSRSRRFLREISREIRRIAWNPAFHAEARRLADLADQRAEEIETRRGLVPTGRLPRWDGCYSGPTGIYRPAVP